MIYLTKGQKLFDDKGMVVCDPTGYYEDGTAVACAVFHSPEEPIFRYEARFIAYGDQVYNIADDKKLMEEIIKIDPNTLLGKTKEDISVDEMVEKIEIVDNPTPESIPEEIPEEVEPISETVETTTEIDENGNEVTTTTITEETIPEDIDTDTTIPVVDEPVIIPELPVEAETIINPTADEVVSRLKKKKKIV